MEPRTIKSEPIGNGCYVLVDSVHTFGTDAILLADFAAPKRKDKACDLCTGCGIIPMLWARDGTLSAATGVELQPDAVQLFNQTIRQNNMETTLCALHADIRALEGVLPAAAFDLITCNPPYKAAGAGLKNTDPALLLARHEVACTLRDVIAAAARLLRFSGRLCLCHRPERLADIFCTMREYRIEPKRLRLVAKSIGSEPWLALIEGRLGGNAGLRVEPVLYVENDGEFSEEMRRIYGAYMMNG